MQQPWAATASLGATQASAAPAEPLEDEFALTLEQLQFLQDLSEGRYFSNGKWHQLPLPAVGVHQEGCPLHRQGPYAGAVLVPKDVNIQPSAAGSSQRCAACQTEGSGKQKASF